MKRDKRNQEFPPLQNAVLLRTAQGVEQTRAPVWAMRQAGRYMAEYHVVREKANDFFGLCQNPELACEVTLQPIDRFNLDAAIIFSDILVIPQALGMEVIMKAAKGPVFPSPLQSPADLSKLLKPEGTSHPLNCTLEAIQLVRHRLNGRVPLIGFCGAPWTLMAYMIEGEGSKTFSKAKSWLYKYPKESHELLQRITDTSVEYLVEQVKHGAQLLKLFDSWAGILSPEAFAEFSLPYLKQIEERVKKSLEDYQKGENGENLEYIPPMIVFAKGAHYSYDALIKQTNYEVIALDWETDISSVLKVCNDNFPRKVCLQGNLDPCVLYAEHDVIKQHTKKMVEEFHKSAKTVNYIANLGHGIYPDLDPNNVGCFIDSIHEFSKIYGN